MFLQSIFGKKNDFKVENLENIYHFSSTILTLFYLISRRYMKKNQMKMHCVSHVVKGTVYITIISDNNSFFLPDCLFNSIKGPQKKLP